MTRRIVNPQPNEDGVTFMPVAPCLDWEQIYNDMWKPWQWETEEGETIHKFSKYGEKGDVLWVRESITLDHNISGGDDILVYKADYPEYTLNSGQRWKPSIHMPKTACRIFLQVESIRVERLNDISEVDAISEGILSLSDTWVFDAFPDYLALHKKWLFDQEPKPPLGPSPVMRFRELWKQINGYQSWDDNPWVWVIEFKRIEQPEGFLTANQK